MSSHWTIVVLLGLGALLSPVLGLETRQREHKQEEEFETTLNFSPNRREADVRQGRQDIHWGRKDMQNEREPRRMLGRRYDNTKDNTKSLVKNDNSRMIEVSNGRDLNTVETEVSRKNIAVKATRRLNEEDKTRRQNFERRLCNNDKELNEDRRANEIREDSRANEIREDRRENEIKEERGADEIREGRGVAELREDRRVSELREGRKANEIREGRRANEIREDRRVTELEEDRRANEIREDKRVAELGEDRRANEIREDRRVTELGEDKRANEIREGRRANEIREDRRANEIREGRRVAELREDRRATDIREGRLATDIRSAHEIRKNRKESDGIGLNEAFRQVRSDRRVIQTERQTDSIDGLELRVIGNNKEVRGIHNRITEYRRQGERSYEAIRRRSGERRFGDGTSQLKASERGEFDRRVQETIDNARRGHKKDIDELRNDKRAMELRRTKSRNDEIQYIAPDDNAREYISHVEIINERRENRRIPGVDNSIKNNNRRDKRDEASRKQDDPALEMSNTGRENGMRVNTETNRIRRMEGRRIETAQAIQEEKLENVRRYIARKSDVDNEERRHIMEKDEGYTLERTLGLDNIFFEKPTPMTNTVFNTLSLVITIGLLAKDLRVGKC